MTLHFFNYLKKCTIKNKFALNLAPISTGEIMDRPKMSTQPFHISTKDCDCIYKVIDTFPSAIVLLDLNKQTLFWNLAAEKLFFCKKDAVIGKNLPFIPQYHEDDFAECIEMVVMKINNDSHGIV